MKAKRPGRACRWGGRRPAHREETKLNLEKVLRTRSLLRGEEPSGPLPTDSELLRETLRIAWPSMLESFLVALVGFIDTVMVSGLGTAAIAAVGLTTQPKFICLAVFLSLNVAVSALVARRRGQDDPEKKPASLVADFSLVADAAQAALEGRQLQPVLLGPAAP